MSDRERKTILGYDKEALIKNIAKFRKEIEMLFAEIQKRNEKIAEYEQYIKMIEEAEKKKKVKNHGN